MKSILNYTLACCLMVGFSLSTYAQTNNLCQLPEGKFSRERVIVYDKSTATRERYDITLNVAAGKQASGEIVSYDLLLKTNGETALKFKERYFIALSGCSRSNPVFTVSGIGGSELSGYFKILDINRTLGKITLVGGIHTYTEGLAGWVEWAADQVWDLAGADNPPEIDLRNFPVELKR